MLRVASHAQAFPHETDATGRVRACSGQTQVAWSTVRGLAEVALCQRYPCALWGCPRPRATERTKPVATEQKAKGSWQSGQGPKVGQGRPQLCGA